MEKQKLALVTGSEGFVGRHLVPKLHEAGYRVICVDTKLGFTFEAWSKSVSSWKYEGDTKFDVIVHLAANIEDVSVRMRKDLSAYADMSLDYQVCELVRKFPPREAFICMSSCAVDNPIDPYGWTKQTLELYATALHREGIPTVILRPFSGYGADQAFSYPFPAILARAMRREDPLRVWGNINTERDWIHIDDLTRAIMWAITSAPRGIPIDIGRGVGIPFWSLATNIASAVGYRPQITGDGSKPSSSNSRVARPEFAEKHGFKANINIIDGIDCAVEYARHHATLYKTEQHTVAGPVA